MASPPGEEPGRRVRRPRADGEEPLRATPMHRRGGPTEPICVGAAPPRRGHRVAPVTVTDTATVATSLPLTPRQSAAANGAGTAQNIAP